MNKEEAIKQMKLGKKITHPYFADDEWVKTDKFGEIYIFQDGVECNKNYFWSWRKAEIWNDGWQEYADQQSQEDKKRIAELESKLKELKEVADEMAKAIEHLINGYLNPKRKLLDSLTKYKQHISK